MPIAGFAPLGAAAALMPAIPGCCLWALCARPPDGRGTYRKKSIFKPRPPPPANSRLATLGFRTSLLLITMMSSRIQFGNAVHEAENVRSCGLTAQFADFFLARTGPWKHQAAASLVRSGEHNKQVVAKDRAATTTSLWQKIGRPHQKFVAQRSGKNARVLAKCPQKPPGTPMRLTRGRTTSHQLHGKIMPGLRTERS